MPLRHVLALCKNDGKPTLYQSFADINPFHDALSAGCTLLTPGRRLARQLTLGWLSTQSPTVGVAHHPDIEPIDAWLESRWLEAIEAGQIPAQKLLSRLEEHLIWLSVINTDSNYGDSFRLLQPQAAAEQARICRDALIHYGPDHATNALNEYASFDLDCQVFSIWLERFENTLYERHWATRADAYRQLTQLTLASKPRVLLAHTLELTPLAQRAIDQMANVSVMDLHEFQEHQALIQGTRFSSVEQELAHIAAWAAQRHREGRLSTAIVLMNFKRDRPLLEYYLRQEFDCLDARYHKLPVNFATGQSLASVPMFRDALLALTLHIEPLTRQRLLSLLRSPYLLEANFHESEQGVQLVKSLFDLGTDPIDWSDFSHWVALHAPNSRLALMIASLRIAPQRKEMLDLHEWVERLRSSLQLWQWPSRIALDSMEYQQFDRFERSLDQLVSLSEVAGLVDYSRAVSLWRACLDDLVFQPKTESTALQVLGPQEAVGLSFDALHICGLQVGVLPAKPRLLPFLPAVLQRQWCIPSADSNQLLRQAMTLIGSWRVTHGQLSASYFGWAEGLEQHASPLLAIDESPEPPKQLRPTHWRAATQLQFLEDSTTQGSVDGPEVPFGGGASVLQNQSACAFRAWFRHRLGATPLTQTILGLTAAERGSVIHYALYYFWGRVSGSLALRGLSKEDCRRLIADSVTEAIRSLEQRNQPGSLRKRVGSTCLEIEADRIQRLLAEWLNHEQKRSVDYLVVEREQAHVLAIGPLELRLRPDRIDQLEDGRRLVIDYKTGRPSRSSWLGERPTDPQLPLYALLNDDVQGLAFARLRRGEVEFIELGDELGLKAREKTLTDQLKKSQTQAETWQALTIYWQRVLESLAEDYVRGDATINPAQGACRYCDLDHVCRYRHQNTELSDQDGTSIGVYDD